MTHMAGALSTELRELMGSKAIYLSSLSLARVTFIFHKLYFIFNEYYFFQRSVLRVAHFLRTEASL